MACLKSFWHYSNPRVPAQGKGIIPALILCVQGVTRNKCSRRLRRLHGSRLSSEQETPKAILQAVAQRLTYFTNYFLHLMWLEKVAADLPMFVKVDIVNRWVVYSASTCILRLTVA